MSTPDVKEALERKKKKLEELQKKRDERRQISSAAPAVPSKPADVRPVYATPAAVGSSSAAPVSSVSADTLLANVSALIGSSPATAAASEAAQASAASAARRAPVQLAQPEKALVVDVEIEPEIRTTYEVSLQFPEEKDGEESQLLQAEMDKEEKDRLTIQQQNREKREREEQELQETLRKHQADEEKRRREAVSQQRGAILASAAFSDFFNRSTMLVERALSQNERYDIAIDYSRDKDEEGKASKAVITPTCQFALERATAGRPVMSIDWSPEFPELVLASYGQKILPSQQGQDGLVMVWNTQSPYLPVYTFDCPGTVLTAQFHPSDHKLIVGGTISGQLVLWDTRQKSTPVIRTSLANGHTHPVYALSTIPSNQLNNIMTCSTDGLICLWNGDALVKPGFSLPLRSSDWHGSAGAPNAPPDANRDCTTSTLGFPARDTTQVVVGTDEGWLLRTRVELRGGKADISYTLDAHKGPITAVRFHPGFQNSKDIFDLYLTSSFDWSVKLWSLKSPQQPIMTFESAKDYVYDVQWSPSNPGLFVAADGMGFLDFWDLNKDQEMPLHRVNAFVPAGADEAKRVMRERAVSRLKWNNHGTQLAVGASDGVLSVFDVSPDVVSTEAGIQFYDALHNRMTRAVSDAADGVGADSVPTPAPGLVLSPSAAAIPAQ